MKTLSEFLTEKLAARQDEFAPGIPKSKAVNEIPTVSRFGKPTTWWFVDHKHEAERAGLHTDLRLSDGRRAYSWAVPKGIPERPGEKVEAIRQPDHSVSYLKFEGQIAEGYGKTKGRGVWINEEGPARVLNADPDKITFSLIGRQNPSIFTMVRRGEKDWLLINTTPTAGTRPGVPQSKPKYREDQPENFQKWLTDGNKTAVSAKIDGAHVSINFDRASPELYSYRPSERSTGLINHTFITNLDKAKTPEAIQGARVRGEVYAVDSKGRAIPNRELGGILNSAPQKGLDTLKQKGYQMRIGVFDVVSGPGGKRMDDAPWSEKYKVLQRVAQSMKKYNFDIPETAFTPEEQKRLFTRIQSGKNPITNEGVVVWHTEKNAPPVKIKFRPHQQAYIHTIYEGTGRLKGTMSRYSYSLEPGGPEVGFVGTGFDDATRAEMWKNRKALQGRKVIVKSSEQFPSGAYRAPSHSHYHE